MLMKNQRWRWTTPELYSSLVLDFVRVTKCFDERIQPFKLVGNGRRMDDEERVERGMYWLTPKTNGLAWRHFQQTNILSYICNFLHHSPSISFHPWPSYVYCKTKSIRFKMQAANKILGTIQKPLHSSFRQRYFSALTGVQRENALKNLFKPGLFSWKQVRCMPEFYAGCNIRVVLSFLQKNFTKYSHHLPLI